MSFPSAEIGTLVEPVQTWNPSTRPQHNFQYLDLSSVDQTTKEINAAAFLVGEDAPSRARQLVRSGDILVSTVRPNLNGVAPVYDRFDGATASTGFCVLRPNQTRLDTAYLKHWVRCPLFVDRMVREATGASYPAISDRIVKASQIPLPPLDEQRRIAAILDKADALRRKRKHALDLLDSLTQSIFLDTFGDPVSNSMSWPTKLISEVSKVVTGNTPPRQNKSFYGSDIEWIKSDNIDPTNLFLSKASECLSDLGKSMARIAPLGATLVTCIAGSPNSIGNAAMANREVAFNQQINALIPKNIEPLFLYFHIKIGKRLVQYASTGGMKGLVSKSRLENVRVIYPPDRHQGEFARRARKVELAKKKCRSGRLMSEALFTSLQSRAFSGQL